MAIVYILLGTNLGEREVNLHNAISALEMKTGQLLDKSYIYETAAWGIEDQPSFYNQVIKMETRLSPETLLKKILDIELAMGRVRIKKWYTRLIDIDILYYNQLSHNTSSLVIPHKEIPNRKFTLIPLVEIAPDYIHPVHLKTNQELLNLCNDELEVKKIN